MSRRYKPPTKAQKRRSDRIRRARRVGSDLTPGQWFQILAGWDGRCAYCGGAFKAITKDCVIPLRRGGCYTLANVVPACRSCNGSKSGKNVVRWMRKKGYDVDAFETKMLEVVLQCS